MKTLLTFLANVLVWLILVPIFWLRYSEEGPQQTLETELVQQQANQQLDQALLHLQTNIPKAVEQRGDMYVFGAVEPLTDQRLRQRIAKLPIKQRSYSYSWSWDGIADVAMSANATDRNHYFANSFLIGYSPFQSQNTWVPLSILAQRKSYVKDEHQYPGYYDVWQNSRESFVNARGDCEDHAIALADWLIDMGKDARVVLGEMDSVGHAWVVLFENEHVYLIEATSKSKNRQLNVYPVAKYESKYQPESMFNRQFYWVNESKKRTTDYQGGHWILKSKFVAKVPSV